MRKPDLIKSLLPLMIVFVISGWVLVNSDFRVGSIYSLLIIGSMVMYFILINNRSKNLSLFKIDSTLFLGVIASVVFGFIAVFSPNLAISIPQPVMAFDSVQNFMYVVVLASVVEEFMFRGWVLTVLRSFTSDFIAVFVSSASFSLYHASVYGATLQMSFIGALMFGALASYITIWTGNLGSSMIMHSSNNAIKFIQNNSLLSII